MTYAEKIAEAFIKAIMENGLQQQPDGSQTIMIDSAAVTTCCLDTIAFVCYNSIETTTPAKTRRLCDDLARRLQRKIASAQKDERLAAMNVGVVTLGTAH